MAEVITTPELRFPEFEEDWELTQIEKYFEFKNGLNKEKEYFGRGTPIINFMDVYKLNSIHKKDINGLVELTESEIQRYSALKGDVFFTRTSETIHDIGMSATLIEEIPNCVFSGFVLRARPLSNKFDPIFTSFLFNVGPVRKEIITKSSMTTRALTSGTSLNKVYFKFPKEQKEQQKIASFLTAIDQRIQLLQKKKAKLEEYKKGVMQKLFSQQICFKDENGNEFPDWKEKKLGEICNKQSSNISANSLEESGGDYKIYGATGFLQFVDFYREEELYISIVKDGAGVGRILLCEAKSSVLGTLDILKPKEENNIKFLYALISNIRFEKYITGSTIPHIYFKDYSKEKINVPIPAEQHKIAAFLTSIDDSIVSIRVEIDGSIEYKKGLLQKMFV